MGKYEPYEKHCGEARLACITTGKGFGVAPAFSGRFCRLVAEINEPLMAI
jgi:hypothetical protein